jgi:hypothetical protein
MKRERRTYYLDPAVVHGLRLVAADLGIKHSDVVESAVAEMIRRHGYGPGGAKGPRSKAGPLAVRPEGAYPCPERSSLM